MPHVEIRCFPGRTEDQKKDCAAKVTEAIVQTMGCDESSVSVAIKEIPKEEWKSKVWDPSIAKEMDDLYKQPGYDM